LRIKMGMEDSDFHPPCSLFERPPPAYHVKILG
jgi:hypothetical protein